MRYLFIFLMMIIIASCTGASKVRYQPPRSISLHEGGRQQIGNLVIVLKEIRDSRCPVNVNCIRAGEAIATLNVVDNNHERNIQLCTGADCTPRALYDAYNYSLEGETYIFKLDSIVPYPGRADAATAKKVYFNVTQLK